MQGPTVSDVERLYPSPTTVAAKTVALDARAAAHGTIRAFDDRVIEFLDSLSKRLFLLARPRPELAPLAFFLRRSATARLASGTLGSLSSGARAVPQGVMLHIPPTNVDTLFLYTLAIALLAGNSNIVRISQNAGPATHEILEILFDELDRDPEIARLVTVVRFGRDEESLRELTSVADVRMIWGGDASIETIRRAPLQAHAKDLTFPDRLSIAAISVDSWNEADESTRDSLIAALYNDSYWFDQMACSSPQQLLFVGDQERASVAMREVLEMLADVARQRYELPGGQAINKMVAVVEGVARGSGTVSWVSNSSVGLAALTLDDAIDIRPGGGFFSTQQLDALVDFAPQVTRRVQTLGVFGFDRPDLDLLVDRLNGRGIDRIVPIGTALDFSQIWDGKNLVLESLRLVSLNV